MIIGISKQETSSQRERRAEEQSEQDIRQESIKPIDYQLTKEE